MMTVVCCSKCYQAIEKRNKQSADIWVNLCASFTKQNGYLRLREWLVPEYRMNFRYLEKTGFVSSMDHPGGVFLRVNGRQLRPDNHESDSYCLFRDLHWASENTMGITLKA
jgi:hypothetical protein